MPSPIDPQFDDVGLGRLLRDKRVKAGLSQTAMADAVGVSFQQLQKYESGRNRLSVTRLAQIAAVLGTSPSALLSEVGGPSRRGTAPPETSDAGRRALRAFEAIADPMVRKTTLSLLESLASTGPKRDAGG